MDYLDPEKKKAHTRRLYFGYGLIAIAIALTTVILVYLASGYYVDRKTGDLIQNGQIIVASQPEGASIYLNEKLQKTKTTGKLVVPSGSYDVSVQKEGYKTWKNSVALDGGVIRRLDYLLLIPEVMQPTIMQTFSDTPYQITQSIDRRYMSLLFSSQPTSLYIYDIVRPEIAPFVISLPQDLFKDPKSVPNISVVEWSDDNKHMLVTNTNAEGKITDYLLVSRDTSEPPVNLSVFYGLSNQQLQLINNKKDSYFIFDAAAQTLSTASLQNPITTQRLTNVLDFKAYDENNILYITPSSLPEKVAIKIVEGSETFLIREVPKDSGYVYGIAKQGATILVGAGSTQDNKVAVYRNPVGYLRANKDKQLPLATTIFLVEKPEELSFSLDNSVIAVRGGKTIATHYFDEDKTSRYDVPLGALPQKLVWVDGKHLMVSNNNMVSLFDFDGTNLQTLTQSNSSLPIFFDNNYRSLFTFSSQQKPFHIQRSSMVIER